MGRPEFDCDKCGACCRSLIVEASYIDAMREPRLYQVGPPLDHEAFRRGEQCVMLYDTVTLACPFLSDSNECGIYATRPHCCVAVEPGDAKCQQAREHRKLEPLRDKTGALPTLAFMEASVAEYDLDWVPFFEALGGKAGAS